jgi:hypothetical protein
MSKKQLSVSSFTSSLHYLCCIGKARSEVEAGICKSCFLDFVHRLYFNKITTFRKLDLRPSSGKKEGQKPQLLGPLVELAPDLDSFNIDEPGAINGGQQSFRNVVILLKYRRWTKSKKQLLQIITYHRQNLLDFV